jgi:hypothetical protein
MAALGTRFAVNGGNLRFAGGWDAGASGWPIDGQLDVRKFTLARATILARVTSLVSLSGLTRALSGSGGVAFDRLDAELSHRDDVLTIGNGRATGDSLGLVARGVVDFGNDTVDVAGSLVPAYYGLNRVPARVPVLGQVLTGREKEGIQVFDFTAKGPASHPEVSARPSSVAPGVVRDLFRLFGK